MDDEDEDKGEDEDLTNLYIFQFDKPSPTGRTAQVELLKPVQCVFLANTLYVATRADHAPASQAARSLSDLLGKPKSG